MLNQNTSITGEFIKHDIFNFNQKEYCKISLLMVDTIVKIAFKGDFKKLETLQRGESITLECNINYYNGKWTLYAIDLE